MNRSPNAHRRPMNRNATRPAGAHDREENRNRSASNRRPRAGTVPALRVVLLASLVAVFAACDDSSGPASDPPEVTITAPDDGSLFQYEESITFQGSAEDPEDGPLTGDALEWDSDIDGIFGTGGDVTVSDLSAGTHEILLIATDSDGVEGTASIIVVVEEPPR